jgi:hypothetical protein
LEEPQPASVAIIMMQTSASVRILVPFFICFPPFEMYIVLLLQELPVYVRSIFRL